MNLQKIRAFTLVELIVVITILAILWTIAFITLNWYSKQARDSSRISDLSTIKTSLELFYIDAGKYPLPTYYSDITYSWAVVWKQWTFWDSTFTNVWKLNKLPLDQLTNSKYTYSVLLNRNEYQLGWVLETDLLWLDLWDWLTSVSYAWEEEATAIVTGNYNEQMTKTLNESVCNVLSLPTIIASDIEESTNLVDIIENERFVFSWFKNLPSSYKKSKFRIDGWFKFKSKKLVVYTDTNSCTELANNETLRIQLLKNLQEAYSWTILEEEIGYSELLNTEIDLFSPNNATKLLSRSVVNSDLSIKLNEESLTFLTCETWIEDDYSYSDMPHWWSSSVTKVWSVSNWVLNYWAQASCYNWVVTILSENTNLLCNWWYVGQWWICVLDVCTWWIPINGSSNATSQTVSNSWVNNNIPWVCTFECNTNYTWNWSICEADTQVISCTWLPTDGSWNTVSSITQTWNGTSWLPLVTWAHNITSSTTTCNFKCDTNYTWNWLICVADTQSENCLWSIVSNASATTPSTFTQTWDGSIWAPVTWTWWENHAFCDFDCNTNYTWDWNSCIADTTSTTCWWSIPSNASSTAWTTYTQTWNWIIWTPTTTWWENQASCDYDCDLNYTWNGSMCTADIQVCAISNWSWTQIWNGSSWLTCNVLTCNTDYYETSITTCWSVWTWKYSPSSSTSIYSCSNSPSDNTSRNYYYTSDGNGSNSCWYTYSEKCWTDSYESSNWVCSSVGTWKYSPFNNNTIYSCSNKPSWSSYTWDGNWSNNCPYSYSYSWYTWSYWSCSASPYWWSYWSCNVSCWWWTKYRTCNWTNWTKNRTVYCRRSDLTSVSDSYCSWSKPSSSVSCTSSCSWSNSTSCNTQSCISWGWSCSEFYCAVLWTWGCWWNGSCASSWNFTYPWQSWWCASPYYMINQGYWANSWWLTSFNCKKNP